MDSLAPGGSRSMQNVTFAGRGGSFGGGGRGGSFGGGGGRNLGGGFGGGGFGGPSFGGGGYSGGGGGSFLGGLLGGMIGSRIARGGNRGGYPMPPSYPQQFPHGAPYQNGPFGDDFDDFGGPGGGPRGSGGPGGPGGGPGGGPYGPQQSPGGGKSPVMGCGVAFIIISIIFIVLMLMFGFGLGSCTGENVAASTVQRQALPSGSVTETGWYTDEAGIIQTPNTLEVGMRDFYEKTGIQPYLYILPYNATMSGNQLSQYAEQLYNQLFSDKAHFLLVFCPESNGYYNAGYWMGDQTKSILDDEAISIFQSYLDRYWNDNSISVSQAFSDTYASTADRIMQVTPNPTLPVVIVLAIVVIIVAIILFIKHRHDQKEREQARQQQILSTPLEKFGDKDVEDLADSYEESREELEDQANPLKAAIDDITGGDDDKTEIDPDALKKFNDPDLTELENKYKNL